MTGFDTPQHRSGKTDPGDAPRTYSIPAAEPGTTQQVSEDRPATWAVGPPGQSWSASTWPTPKRQWTPTTKDKGSDGPASGDER